MMSGLPPVLNTGKSWHELAEVMPDPWGIGPNGAGYRRGRDIHRENKNRPAVTVRALKKMGHSQRGPFRTEPRQQASILGSQIGVFAMTGGPGRFNQGRAFQQIIERFSIRAGGLHEDMGDALGP